MSDLRRGFLLYPQTDRMKPMLSWNGLSALGAALVATVMAIAAHAEQPAGQPEQFEQSEPSTGVEPAGSAVPVHPAQPLRVPRLTERGPTDMAGEKPPIIVVPRPEPSRLHLWLYGLGAVFLLAAFYLGLRAAQRSSGEPTSHRSGTGAKATVKATTKLEVKEES
jgi:hypothetical protein